MKLQLEIYLNWSLNSCLTFYAKQVHFLFSFICIRIVEKNKKELFTHEIDTIIYIFIKTFMSFRAINMNTKNRNKQYKICCNISMESYREHNVKSNKKCLTIFNKCF